MKDPYAKQKLYEAVLALVGSGSIQERLTSAAIPLLVLRSHQSKGAPRAEQGKLEAILKLLTDQPLSSTTSFIPRSMADSEGQEVAQRILSIYTEVMGGL